jgi:hypothetical protein
MESELADPHWQPKLCQGSAAPPPAEVHAMEEMTFRMSLADDGLKQAAAP